MQYINAAMLVIALVGVVLNVRKQWQGFLLWFGTNGYWAWYFWRLNEMAAALQFAAFAGLCIYGMYAWQVRKAKSPKDQDALRRALMGSRLSNLVYQGNVHDAATINELQRRLQANNIVMGRLLFKLHGRRK